MVPVQPELDRGLRAKREEMVDDPRLDFGQLDPTGPWLSWWRNLTRGR